MKISDFSYWSTVVGVMFFWCWFSKDSTENHSQNSTVPIYNTVPDFRSSNGIALSNESVVKIYDQYKDCIDAVWVELPEETTLAQATLIWIESVLISNELKLELVPLKEISNELDPEPANEEVPEIDLLPNGSDSSQSVESDDLSVLDKFLVGKKSPAIVYFTQKSCPPCRFVDSSVLPIFSKNYSIYKISLDDPKNNKLVEELGVRSTPQFFGIKNGVMIKDENGKFVSVNPVSVYTRGNRSFYSSNTSSILEMFYGNMKVPLPESTQKSEIIKLLEIARNRPLVAYVEPSTWQNYYDHNVRDHGFDSSDCKNLSFQDLQYLHSAAHDPVVLKQLKAIRNSITCPH